MLKVYEADSHFDDHNSDVSSHVTVEKRRGGIESPAPLPLLRRVKPRARSSCAPLLQGLKIPTGQRERCCLIQLWTNRCLV